MVLSTTFARSLAVLSGCALLLICTGGDARCNTRHGVGWYSPAPNNQIREIAAARYEVGICGLASGEDRLTIKQLNPQFRWFVYNSISDNYVPPHPGDTQEHQLIASMAAARGWSVEDAYIHYWDDTRLVFSGDTLFIPGWGGGSATDPAQSRVAVFNAELTRRACNFSTARARQLYKESTLAMLIDIPFPGTTMYADGIFFDNSSGRLFNRGTIISGGHVREMPNHEHIDSAQFRTWYFDNLTGFLGEFKDTMEAGASWSKDGKRKEVMANIANVWDDAYVTRDVADILFLEFLYNPVRDWGVTQIDEAYRRDALAASAGIASFYSATMTRSLPGKVGEYDYDDTLLGNYAWYLLSRTPSTYLYQMGASMPSTAGWDSLTWRGVMDVAPPILGEPIGPPYTLSSGIDPLGNPYEVKARDYQGGLVVLRNRGNWSEGIEPGTAVQVDLPALLTPLDPDGLPMAKVDRLTLRNGQGAILASGPVPVRLLSSSAVRSSDGAWIRWEIAEDSPAHAGFHVHREDETGARVRLTASLLTGSRAYAWLDPAPPTESARYWLAEESRTGETTWFGPLLLEAQASGPAIPFLAQNEPNPFQTRTAIRFHVTESGPHSLLVFDATGREVARLFEGVPALGEHEINWDARDGRGRRVAPGVYFYTLRSPGGNSTHKLLLTR